MDRETANPLGRWSTDIHIYWLLKRKGSLCSHICSLLVSLQLKSFSHKSDEKHKVWQFLIFVCLCIHSNPYLSLLSADARVREAHSLSWHFHEWTLLLLTSQQVWPLLTFPTSCPSDSLSLSFPNPNLPGSHSSKFYFLLFKIQVLKMNPLLDDTIEVDMLL